MTIQEHSRACYTAGHIQYLAEIGNKAGVLTDTELQMIKECSHKLYSWLQSLPQHMTEAMARAVALRNKPQPVERWELSAPVAVTPEISQSKKACRECAHPWDRHKEFGCRALLPNDEICDCNEYVGL